MKHFNDRRENEKIKLSVFSVRHSSFGVAESMRNLSKTYNIKSNF